RRFLAPRRLLEKITTSSGWQRSAQSIKDATSRVFSLGGGTGPAGKNEESCRPLIASANKSMYFDG
ncbi:MAG: hypothetical protein N2C14_10350, partial [Planctomycetales bacterium]